MHLIGRGLLILLFLGVAEAEAAGVHLTGASSSLESKTRVMEWSGGRPHWIEATFQPASAMDGSLATSWCEGADGPGIGEWIEVQVDQPFREVEIAGGFRKLSHAHEDLRGDLSEEQLDAWFDQSVRTYKSNSRPAVLELTTANGKVLEGFHLGDRTLSDYRFPVSLPPGRYRLRIAQVYLGSRFEDSCIAELQFRNPKEPPSPQQVPLALRPIAGRVSCRPDASVKVLPREVLFLGTTVSAGKDAANPSASRTQMAVREPSGNLSPTTDLTCFWGKGFACVADGDAIGDESLGAADMVGEWVVNLGRSTPDVSAPGTWAGHYDEVGEKGPALTFQIGTRTGAKGEPTIEVSARRGKGVVETARYTCAPLSRPPRQPSPANAKE